MLTQTIPITHLMVAGTNGLDDDLHAISIHTHTHTHMERERERERKRYII